jgi:hypothetical protein
MSITLAERRKAAALKVSKRVVPSSLMAAMMFASMELLAGEIEIAG